MASQEANAVQVASPNPAATSLQESEKWASKTADLSVLPGDLVPGDVLSLRKRTASNLFRYGKRERGSKRLDLRRFNHVLAVNAKAREAEVEGLCTFETLVDATLKHGLIPLVTPELKHITLGGAVVGIGIESSGHRHGFVHDALLSADVLLSDGSVLPCSPQENADLFHALPNSYGTLGYILRARLRLMPAKPWVRISIKHYEDLAPFLQDMRKAAEAPSSDSLASSLTKSNSPLVVDSAPDFVEALMLGPQSSHLALSHFVDKAPRRNSLLRGKEFYRQLCEGDELYLPVREYLFRYDPDWFWNLPQAWPFRLLRRLAPASMLHSANYKRLMDAMDSLGWRKDDGKELLIQDWEVPWDRAEELLRFAFSQIDLDGKPWLAVAIRTPRSPTLYPVRAHETYFNLGCYCRVKTRAVGEKPSAEFGTKYAATRQMDHKCFALGGLKMLYSSTFLDKTEFDAHYGGEAYAKLKAKYDPSTRLLDLYRKCARRDFL